VVKLCYWYQLSSGVDASAFISNLINGTGEARQYKAATGYFL
jgi:hypothetical protein